MFDSTGHQSLFLFKDFFWDAPRGLEDVLLEALDLGGGNKKQPSSVFSGTTWKHMLR